MTDRELLEAAAKAAGIEVHGHTDLSGMHFFSLHGKTWDPLADDGDALRLAVKIGMWIGIWVGTHDDGVTVSTQNGTPLPLEEDFGSDPYAATRRAIVRAAAAMAGGDE